MMQEIVVDEERTDDNNDDLEKNDSKENGHQLNETQQMKKSGDLAGSLPVVEANPPAPPPAAGTGAEAVSCAFLCAPAGIDGTANLTGNEAFLSMLTTVPPPPQKPGGRTRRKKKKAKMIYIPKDALIDDSTAADFSADAEAALPIDTPSALDENRTHAETTIHDMNNDNEKIISSTNHSKTTLYISNFNDESQVYLVKSILEPMQGVSSITTHFQQNSTSSSADKSKTVDVMYDPLITSLDSIIKKLNDVRLNTTTLQNSQQLQNSQNSNTEQRNQKNDENDNTTCRSSMFVQGICCASEVPEVTTIIRKSSRKGVKKVSINIPSRMVYVEHDPNEIKINEISKALDREGFEAKIRSDGFKKKNKASLSDGGVNVGVGVGVGVAGRSSSNHESTLMGNPNQQQQSQPTPTLSDYVESTLIAQTMTNMEDTEDIKETLLECDFLPNQVRAFFTNIPSRTIKIEHNPNLISASEVAEALVNVGNFEDVTVHVDGDAENLRLPHNTEIESYGNEDANGKGGASWCDDINISMFSGLRLNIILSGICWALSMVGVVVEKWEYLNYAGILAVLFGIPPVARKAYRTIRRLHFDANCMMVTAAIGALLLGEFDEAASVSFLFAISEYLEDRATRKARLALDAIVNLRPEHANLIDPVTKQNTIVPASDLPVGSLISVRTGDKIAADGFIEEGSSQIDESSLTGEARPIDKSVGDEVFGGTINIGTTRLVIRTTSSTESSAVSRLIRLVEESQSNRSPTEKLVDSFAARYTPVVLVLAFFMCTVPWFLGDVNGRHWTLNGLIIIVIACPCSLTISTPVTYAAGLAAAAKKGIIVKGGSKLEALGRVKTVLFDKTGTLTQGKFQLLHMETVGNERRRDVLQLLAVMETPSSHPLATTLVKAAVSEGINIPKNTSVQDHTILKGEGVTAIVDGTRVFVGNIRLFERLGFYRNLSEAHKNDAIKWSDEGGTVGFIGKEDIGIIAMFCVTDTIRPEAKEAVQNLQQNGVEIIMLTGDGDGAARRVGQELGIPEDCIHSQFLPEDKLHYLASIQGFGTGRKGILCAKNDLMLLCGDGVNDAPALAIADVGVAMGEGSDLAMELSDVTLMDSNLNKLIYSMNMGAKVIVTVEENIAISVFSKLIVVLLTFFGKMSLLGAIASDVGIMLLVSLNGMKLLPSDRQWCRVPRRLRRNYAKVDTEVNNNSEMV